MNKPEPTELYDIHKIQGFMHENYPQFDHIKLFDLCGGAEMYNGSVTYVNYLKDLANFEEEFEYQFGNNDFTYEDFKAYYDTLASVFGEDAAIHYRW